MAVVLRLKLIDLLRLLTEKVPKEREPHTRQLKLNEPKRKERSPLNLEIEKDLEAIEKIMAAGPVSNHDLQMVLNMSSNAVLRRLHLLMDKGTLITIPGNQYQKVG